MSKPVLDVGTLLTLMRKLEELIFERGHEIESWYRRFRARRVYRRVRHELDRHLAGEFDSESMESSTCMCTCGCDKTRILDREEAA